MKYIDAEICSHEFEACWATKWKQQIIIIFRRSLFTKKEITNNNKHLRAVAGAKNSCDLFLVDNFKAFFCVDSQRKQRKTRENCERIPMKICQSMAFGPRLSRVIRQFTYFLSTFLMRTLQCGKCKGSTCTFVRIIVRFRAIWLLNEQVPDTEQQSPRLLNSPSTQQPSWPVH